MAKFNDDLKKFNDNEICYLGFGDNSIIKKVTKDDYFNEKYHLDFVRKTIESLFLGTLSNELFKIREPERRRFREKQRGEIIDSLKGSYYIEMAAARRYSNSIYTWELTYTDDYHIEFVISDNLTIKFIPSKSFVLSLNKLIDAYTISPNYRKGECNFELTEELIKELNESSKGFYERYNMVELHPDQHEEKEIIINKENKPSKQHDEGGNNNE